MTLKHVHDLITELDRNREYYNFYCPKNPTTILTSLPIESVNGQRIPIRCEKCPYEDVVICATPHKSRLPKD